MYDVQMVVIIALVTAATRFLPFLLFGGKGELPPFVAYLGKALPCAVMGMLVIYCLKDVTPLVWPYGLPELLGCGITAGMHIWKRNSLLSIAAGTVSYMLLVQLVF